MVFVPVFLFLSRSRRRMWRTLALEGGGFAAALAAGFLLTAAHFRSAGIWLSWAGRLRALPREALPVTSGNFSLTDLVMWATGSDLSAVLPAAATGAILLAALLLPGEGSGEEGAADPAAEGRGIWFLLAMGCAAFLLASPRAWVHYYVLSLPLLLSLAGMESGGRRAVRIRRGLAALSAAMISVVLPFQYIGSSYPEAYVVGMGFVMWAGVLLAWVAGARELARGTFARGSG
jgi:hypothetical protein